MSTNSYLIRTTINNLVSVSAAERELLLTLLCDLDERLDDIERVLTNVVVDGRLNNLRKS